MSKLRLHHLKRLRETASAAFSKASELGDSLLLLPVILNKKPGPLTATHSAVPRPPFDGDGAAVDSWRIGRWLMAKPQLKHLKRLRKTAGSAAVSSARYIKQETWVLRLDIESRNVSDSNVSCSPAPDSSWCWCCCFDTGHTGHSEDS